MKILRPDEVNAENIHALHWDPLTPEELKEVYALVDASSSPADWDGIDLNDSVPADEFLDEMEKILKQSDAKKAP